MILVWNLRRQANLLPSALMVGAGISATFDADKLLGIIFSKKMRAKARNAKEADAWKSY